MQWKPQDAVGVVTGASSGIGRSLAKLLLRHGASLVLVARRAERLAELKDEFGHQVYPVVGDITDRAVRQQIFELATSLRGGQVDLLVNNAGVGGIGPFTEAPPDRLRTIMEVNFFAPVELSRLLIPALRQGRAPVLCNVCSVLGHRGVPNKSEYCASKFAMHGWSDAIRAELSDTGIQVTLVSPSTTSSEFFDALVDTESGSTSPSMGSMSPDQVAKAALAAIRSRRSEVICSLGGKLLVYGDRVSPPIVNALVARFK